MSFPASRHARLTGETGSGALCVGVRAEDQTPVQLSLSSSGSLRGGDSPKLLPAHPEAGAGGLVSGLQPPSPPLASKVLGHSRRHSLAASAVPAPRAVLEEGQAALVSPGVWCCAGTGRYSRPSSIRYTLVPLHLHRGKEHGGRVSATG